MNRMYILLIILVLLHQFALGQPRPNGYGGPPGNSPLPPAGAGSEEKQP